MAVYRYVTTDLVTGVLTADTLPLRVASFGRTLGGVGQPGQLSATLDLGARGFQSSWLAALEPRRTLLWALADNYPIWAGVLWNWPHASAKADQLPIAAYEIGSLFKRRQVRADQVYTGVDEFNIIRNLIAYALGKGTGAGVAQLAQTTNTLGTTVSVTFPATNLGKISDLIDQFAAQYGIEYAFDPGLTSTGALVITLRIGTKDTMGRPYATTGFQLTYPGNLADYSWPRTGAAGVNSLIATAGNSGGGGWASNPATHGLDSADLAAGYPLLEDSISYSGSVISVQSQIDGFADTKQALFAKSPTVPTATIAGGQFPTAGQIILGDHAMLLASSTLHPAAPNGAPGLVQDVRVIGWTVHPPTDEQAEITDLVLGGVSA